MLKKSLIFEDYYITHTKFGGGSLPFLTGMKSLEIGCLPESPNLIREITDEFPSFQERRVDILLGHHR